MMPMDYTKYPRNWKQISQRIRERDGHRCKWCGVENYAIGARDRFGQWHNENEIENMKSDTGESLFGDYPKMVKIILTVAHIDHNTTNNEDSNLAALCQRCHLNHDRDHHRANAKRTYARRRADRIAATGQVAMFNEDDNQ